MAHIIAFTEINNYCDSHNSGLASSIVNSGEFIGGSIINILIGFVLDLGWTGKVLDGVRTYSQSQYISSFYVFLVISLIGVTVTFIADIKSVKY